MTEHTTMIAYTTWFVAAAVLFELITLRGLWLTVKSPDARRTHLVLVAMTAIGALAYATMAAGIGQMMSEGTQIFLPRYVNWLVATPLMMLFLGWLGRVGYRVTGLLAGLCFVATLSGVAGAFYTSPVISIGGPLLVVAFLYVLMRVLPRHATFENDTARTLFTKIRTLSIVLWPVYVVVLLIAPTGEVRLLVTDTSVLIVAYLDLLFVGGFVTMAQNARAAFDGTALDEPLDTDLADTNPGPVTADD